MFFLGRLPILLSLIGLLISILLAGIGSKIERTKTGRANRNKKMLLEKYKQQIPISASNLNVSLSKAYALYGSVVLTNSKFNGLAEFFKPPVIFNSPSIHYQNRKKTDDESYDFDNDISSDSGCDSDSCSDY